MKIRSQSSMSIYSQYLISCIVILGLYILLYCYIDIPFAYTMHHLHDHALYHIASIITKLGNYKIWLVLSAVFSLVCLGMKQPVAARKGLYVFCSMILAVIVGGILKFVLARYRPELLFHEGLYGFHFFSFQEKYSSSPSGHTLTIFSLCTALAVLYKRYAVLFFTLAVLVGTSRLVLGAHFPSDVLLGAYVGVVAALVCARVLK